MTDAAAAVSAGTTLDTSAAAGTTAAATGAAAGSTSGAADPFSGLDTDTRAWVGTKGYKAVADIATAARNAESLIGRSIQLPGADAKPEDWDKVYDRLGRPKDATAYEFKLPDGLPKDFAYDGERAKAFKSIAHAAGLTPKQAAAVHDAVTKQDAEQFSQLTTQINEGQKAATAALEKAYGGPKDSDAFKQGVNFAVRAVQGLEKLPGVGGLMKALEGAGILHGGMVMEPTVAVALTEIGKRLFKEDSLEVGGSASADNPFTGTNNTLQMQAINADRARAIGLIRAAGKKPEDFGLA